MTTWLLFHSASERARYVAVLSSAKLAPESARSVLLRRVGNMPSTDAPTVAHRVAVRLDDVLAEIEAARKNEHSHQGRAGT